MKTLIETIHSLNPWWFLVPAGLYFIGYLLEEYTGSEFKKSAEERSQDKRELAMKRAQIIKHFGR